MCGGHHVAAGGGKLHELGARILGLEAANVRGDVVNLLVRFRVMNIDKALLSTQASLLTVQTRTSSGKLRTLESRPHWNGPWGSAGDGSTLWESQNR